jgi:plastocyanin
MKSTRVVLSVAALLASAAAPVTAGAAPAAARTARMQASNFKFCPASAPACTPADDGALTVKVGTRVVWVYTDHACDAVVPCPGHNVVFANGSGSRKLVKQQGAVVFSGVFKHPGTFHYVCSAHASFGMTGTVVVKR